MDNTQQELDNLNERLAPMLRRKAELENILRDKRSRDWIKENGVTAENLQLSTGAGIPWHATLWRYAKWLSTLSPRPRFCEWNGRIYHTEELICESAPVAPPGLARHVTQPCPVNP